MLGLYLIDSFVTAIMMVCDIFILTHPKLSIKKYLLLFVSFFTLFFILIYFTWYPLIFVVLAINSFLLVNFTKKFYSFFYVPFGYIVNCVLANVTGLLFNILWDITVQELNADIVITIIYFICTITISCPVLYLVRRLLQKYLIDIFENMSKKLLTLIAFMLLLCAVMILTMASFFDNIDITHREYFLMASSLVLYSLFTISMIFIVLHTTKKSYEAQKKVEYLENLNEYTRNLEMVYENLRSFKHDYINIMASLAAYIDEKKYQELETFF